MGLLYIEGQKCVYLKASPPENHLNVIRYNVRTPHVSTGLWRAKALQNCVCLSADTLWHRGVSSATQR